VSESKISNRPNEDRRTCHVVGTMINDSGRVFAGDRDKTINQVSLNNKNTSFLPEKVVEKFPNLKEYRAMTLKIRVIGKVNFEKLSKLEILNLEDNFISSIESDTFDDLVALEYLLLGEKNSK
jgi:Leucine-rich repeat (LRR) protein